MANGAIQDTKRALVTPPVTPGEDFEGQFRRFYGQLSQQVQILNNSFRQFPLVVGAASGTATLTFKTAGLQNYPDGNYAALATPSWATDVYIALSTDKTATSVKFTFSVNSPAGSSTLYVVTIR